MSYCQKHLGYKESPCLSFQEDQTNGQEMLGKTAYYSPEEKKIVVFTSNRHPKDILRSIAHELIHHDQNCRGEFNKETSTDPGYAQNNPHLRNMEKEAYLKGNMLFRDWEDGIKNKRLKENEEKLSVKKLIKDLVLESISEVKFDDLNDLARDGYYDALNGEEKQFYSNTTAQEMYNRGYKEGLKKHKEKLNKETVTMDNQMIKDIIKQEIKNTVLEGKDIDEGLLDRIRSRIAGAGAGVKAMAGNLGKAAKFVGSGDTKDLEGGKSAGAEYRQRKADSMIKSAAKRIMSVHQELLDDLTKTGLMDKSGDSDVINVNAIKQGLARLNQGITMMTKAASEAGAAKIGDLRKPPEEVSEGDIPQGLKDYMASKNKKGSSDNKADKDDDKKKSSGKGGKMPMKDEPEGEDLNKDGKKGHGKVPAFLDEEDEKEDLEEGGAAQRHDNLDRLRRQDQDRLHEDEIEEASVAMSSDAEDAAAKAGHGPDRKQRKSDDKSQRAAEKRKGLREVKTGDRVKHADLGPGKVVAIKSGQATVRWDTKKGAGKKKGEPAPDHTVSVRSLTKVDEINQNDLRIPENENSLNESLFSNRRNLLNKKLIEWALK